MILYVPLDRITANPWQTRQGVADPEHVKELALDIAANGLLQKPWGRLMAQDDELYRHDNWGSLEADSPAVVVQIAFGHNRLAAYKWLRDVRDHTDIVESYDTMPVEIRRMDDQQMADYAWSENERRRDVNSLERAIAIRKRMDDFGWTQQVASEHLGMSRSAVANILRLLDLPDDVQEHVLSGQISERVALSLLPLYDLPNSLLEKAEKGNYYNGKPSEIIGMAMDGRSSDHIRRAIDQLINGQSKDLQKVDFLDQVFEVAGYIVAETCRDCDWRIKSRNRCTDPDCYQAKKDHSKRQKLIDASRATGIAVHDKVEYEYGDDATSFRYHQNADAVKQTIQSGCENLRLVLSPYGIPADDAEAIPGYENVMVICRKKKGQCTCLHGAEKLAAYDNARDAGFEAPDIAGGDEQADAEGGQNVCTQTVTAERLQEIAKKAKQMAKKEAEIAKAAKDEAVKLMTKAFVENEPKAVRLIYDLLYKGTRWETRPDDIEKIYAGIAVKIIEDTFGYVIDSEIPGKLKNWMAKNRIAQYGSGMALISYFGDDDE